MIWNRMHGPYGWHYWALILCNVVAAAVALVQDACATTSLLLFIISLVVNVGMWLERFVIIVDEPAPRLPAVVVGHVLPDDLGLGDVHRHDRPVPDAVLPVHPLPADDLDLRDARRCCRRRRSQGSHGDDAST